MNAFTLVVPTRDDAAKCEELLRGLLRQEAPGLDLRVVFLVNDVERDGGRLEEIVADERYVLLNPRLLRATRDWLTVEENILHTLGGNLAAVDEHFLIAGNSDAVNLGALSRALAYLQEHGLDLLLIGWLNRELYQGQAVRSLNLTPRHLTAKNRVGPDSCHGRDVFSSFLNDYGPEGHLSFIGCQIYTKAFFKALGAVLSALPEPLYGIPIAALELTAREPWAVGWWPEVTVVRMDHLAYGPDSAEQRPNFWIPLSRTRRGLSRHCVLSILRNSLQLSAAAFETLVNCQQVCNQRASPHLLFTNFLFSFVEQMRNLFREGVPPSEWRYSAGELQDIVSFGERLAGVDIGLEFEQRLAISQWFRCFGVLGDYSDAGRVRRLMAGVEPVLMLLDARPGMERWVAQRNG